MIPVIETQAVSKIFEGGRGRIAALDGISMSVDRGEIMAFLGPSGCGKSTLLDILAGLTNPSSGKVLVDGEAPRPRREIGLMFQKSLLFPWRNVLDNVLLPAEVLRLDKDASRERAVELLEMVGLSGWGDNLPSELSGGMQQRVALARVLLPDPEVLLLDEPFGALDEMTRESLDLELARIAQLTHKTVVFVTHNVYEAVLISDRICVFTPRPGRVAGIVDVPMDRPRSPETLTTDLFSEKVYEVRDIITSFG